MPSPKARLSSAIICALALAGRAGLLRGEEPKPLNSLHLSDVQADDAGASIPEPTPRAVVLPPVPLDRRIYINLISEFDAHGAPACVPKAPSHYYDIAPSPTYQKWLSFFENGTTAPRDFGGEWILVGEITFKVYSRGFCIGQARRCKSGCVGFDVAINPEGLNALNEEIYPHSPESHFELYEELPKMKLEFSNRSVSVSAMRVFGGIESHDGGAHWRISNFNPNNSAAPRVYDYSESSAALNWDSPQDIFKNSRWECRMFKDDGSKLICGISYPRSGSNQHGHFLIYSRDDGKDLLEPLPAILKPFAAPSPPAVTLQKRREKY